MVDIPKPKKSGLAAKDILKNGLRGAINGVVEALGGSGPAFAPNFTQPKMPDINDAAGVGSDAMRAPSEDPQKPEDQQLHLQHEQAPAVKINPQDLVKSLEKLHTNIIDYLGVIDKNNEQEFKYIDSKMKGYDASIATLSTKVTKIEKITTTEFSRIDRELRNIKSRLDMSGKKGDLFTSSQFGAPSAKLQPTNNNSGSIDIGSAIKGFLTGGAGTALIGSVVTGMLPTLLSAGVVAGLFAQPAYNAWGVYKGFKEKGFKDFLGTPDPKDWQQKQRMGYGGWTHHGMWEGANRSKQRMEDITPYTDPWAIPGFSDYTGGSKPLNQSQTPGSGGKPFHPNFADPHHNARRMMHPAMSGGGGRGPAMMAPLLNMMHSMWGGGGGSAPGGGSFAPRPLGSGEFQTRPLPKSLSSMVQTGGGTQLTQQPGGGIGVQSYGPPGMPQGTSLSSHDLISSMRAITAGMGAVGGGGGGGGAGSGGGGSGGLSGLLGGGGGGLMGMLGKLMGHMPGMGGGGRGYGGSKGSNGSSGSSTPPVEMEPVKDTAFKTGGEKLPEGGIKEGTKTGDIWSAVAGTGGTKDVTGIGKVGVGREFHLPPGAAQPPGGGGDVRWKKSAPGSYDPDSGGPTVDKGSLYNAAYAKIPTSVVGFVPSDGAAYGIKTGSRAEYARLVVMMAQQESGLRANPPPENAQHSGTAGLLQFDTDDLSLRGLGNTKEAVADPNKQLDATMKEFEKIKTSGRLGGDKIGLGEYFGPMRRGPNAADSVLRHQDVALAAEKEGQEYTRTHPPDGGAKVDYAQPTIMQPKQQTTPAAAPGSAQGAVQTALDKGADAKVLAQAAQVVQNGGNHEALKKYFDEVGVPMDSATCAEFAMAVQKHRNANMPMPGEGLDPTNASSWLKWGSQVDAKAIQPGDVAVSTVATYNSKSGKRVGEQLTPGEEGGHMGVVQSVDPKTGKITFMQSNPDKVTPDMDPGSLQRQGYQFRHHDMPQDATRVAQAGAPQSLEQAKQSAGIVDESDRLKLPTGDKGYQGGGPTGFVIHHTSDLYNPDDPAKGIANGLRGRGLSVNYFIDRAGKIHQMTPEGEVAFHALGGGGTAGPKYAGMNNYNSIGVEIEGENAGAISQTQLDALKRLGGYVKQRYPSINPDNIRGHGEIQSNHPNPKYRKEEDEGLKGAEMLRGMWNDLSPSGAPDPNTAPTPSTPTAYDPGVSPNFNKYPQINNAGTGPTPPPATPAPAPTPSPQPVATPVPAQSDGGERPPTTSTPAGATPANKQPDLSPGAQAAHESMESFYRQNQGKTILEVAKEGHPNTPEFLIRAAITSRQLDPDERITREGMSRPNPDIDGAIQAGILPAGTSAEDAQAAQEHFKRQSPGGQQFKGAGAIPDKTGKPAGPLGYKPDKMQNQLGIGDIHAATRDHADAGPSGGIGNLPKVMKGTVPLPRSRPIEAPHVTPAPKPKISMNAMKMMHPTNKADISTNLNAAGASSSIGAPSSSTSRSSLGAGEAPKIAQAQYTPPTPPAATASGSGSATDNLIHPGAGMSPGGGTVANPSGDTHHSNAMKIMHPSQAAAASVVQETSKATATAVEHAHVQARKIMHPHASADSEASHHPDYRSGAEQHSHSRRNILHSDQKSAVQVPKHPDYRSAKEQSRPSHHPRNLLRSDEKPKRGQPPQDTSSDKGKKPGTAGNPSAVTPSPQHREANGTPVDQTSPQPGHMGSGDQHGKDGTSICAV